MKKSLSGASICSSGSLSTGMRKSVSTNSLFSLENYELNNESIHQDLEYLVSKMPITKLAECNMSKYLNLPKAPSIQVDELQTIGSCLAEPSETIANIEGIANTRYYWLERSLDEKEVGIRHANLYARIRRKKK
jgi:hypothetical protein